MQQDQTSSRSNDTAGPTREALEALRREIDNLDDAMLELVERRVAAAMGIAELKRSETDGRLRLRPAREAAVVERLVGQAQVAPLPLVRQVWREIMACCLELQVRTELVLHAKGRPAELVDAMRHRFGCAGRMVAASSPAEALESAREREAVAVIEIERQSDWWVALADDPALAVFECLRDDQGHPIGLAVARIAAEDLKACPDINIVVNSTTEGAAPDAELIAASATHSLLLGKEARR
jgi:chorismate mutase